MNCSRKLPSAITYNNFRSGMLYILSYTIRKADDVADKGSKAYF